MASNPNSFLSKYSDIVLALVVVAIVGMMIVPLPTLLLDVLLTLWTRDVARVRAG
ncbi:hypothetical protein STIAU_4386, partial [Stigmatella aurantiaca DW4/3-1]